jgi:hypothetical protein
MAFINFFRTPKHQRYDYKPRYWNQKKEELNERLQRIEKMKDGDPEEMKTRLAGSFRRGGYVKDGNFRRNQVRRSNLILLSIVVALILFSYVFLSVYLPKIVEALEGNG